MHGLRMARRAAWYWKRLSVMGPRELIHRVGEQWALRAMEARYAARGADAHGAWPVVPPGAFGAASAPRLPELPWALDLDAGNVDALLEGRSTALGFPFRWRPDPAVWHEAPDTGASWPCGSFRRIPHREGNPYGDVRVVWEPSRLQHLVTLALLSRRGAAGVRERAAVMVERQFLSWIEGNPPMTGVHYVSAMECALRLVAACHALDLVRGALRAPERVWPALAGLVASHAPLIEQRISRYSSRGNHTVAEATGLLYAGLLFPELDGGGRWQAIGLALLEAESSQILPDGGGVEQALWYHLFVTDLYGLAITLLAHLAMPVPAALLRAHRCAVRFLMAFADGPADLPPIGDADGGYALSPHLRLSWRRPRRRPRLVTFREAGFSIVRSVAPVPTRLVLDHGPLGLLPSCGHGHADALSVTFRVGDMDVLIDAGTFTYTGERRWRTYFRSTRAHNTVTVDGLDQARQETPFAWSRPFRGELVEREEAPGGGVRLVATHDGYARRPGRVVHWRGVAYRPPGIWLVWDYIAGSGTHALDLYWHLGATPRVDAETYRLGGPAAPVTVTVSGGEPSLHEGEETPIAGWASTGYGIRVPVTTLRVRRVGPLPHAFATRIAVGSIPDRRRFDDASIARFREWVR